MIYFPHNEAFLYSEFNKVYMKINKLRNRNDAAVHV